MVKIKAYNYTRKGKRIHVKAHNRRVYKGYRKGRRSYLADRRQHAKYAPAEKYKKGIGHKGDW